MGMIFFNFIFLGVFDDIMSEMCREVSDMNSNLNLLMPTPNGKDDVGLHRDKYLFNADNLTSKKAQFFRFLGILIGVAIRTNKPIAINLAPIIWKLLSLSQVTIDDIQDVDYLYVKSLKNLRDLNVTDAHFKEVIPHETFMGTTFTGHRIALCQRGKK